MSRDRKPLRWAKGWSELMNGKALAEEVGWVEGKKSVEEDGWPYIKRCPSDELRRQDCTSGLRKARQPAGVGWVMSSR